MAGIQENWDKWETHKACTLMKISVPKYVNTIDPHYLVSNHMQMCKGCCKLHDWLQPTQLDLPINYFFDSQ